MTEPLTDADLTLLLQSLDFTRQRLDDVDGCISKIRALRAGSRTK